MESMNIYYIISIISQRGKKTWARYWLIRLDRSSRPEVVCKKGVLGNFTKFIGKHPCQSLLFNKVAGLGMKKKKKRDCGTDVFL